MAARRNVVDYGERRIAWLIFVPEHKPALVQVVRRNFHLNLIARHGANAVLLHAPRGVGDDIMPIAQFNPKARIGQDLGTWPSN